MKYILSFTLALFCTATIADQRLETVGGFCHLVTPEGFQTNNDDNEMFLANCLNSIRQNADGTGSGSTLVKIKYPANALPFYGEYEYSGAETGVNCVMVDSNGTTYVTQDWDSVYKSEIEDIDDFRDAIGTDDEDYDLNGNGIVDGADYSLWKSEAKAEIKFTLTCRNGAQQ